MADEPKASLPGQGRCDECGSTFRRAASRMEALCAECAHQLYGHAPCQHVIEAGRCTRCGWDGSVSDYVRSLKARPPGS